MSKSIYKRHIESRLAEALQDSPAVLIQGPRQCGKTTLAQTVGGSAVYMSFDDENTRSFAEKDPIGFVESLPEHIILDEIQKVPGLFPTIKMAIDGNRKAGRFILTGSVNVLQLSAVSESLAGRMETIRLHPFSQNELEQTPPEFLDKLFSAKFKMRELAVQEGGSSQKSTIKRIVEGGYPEAFQRSGKRLSTWYKNYITALVQRDASEISHIRSPQILDRLLTLAARQSAGLLNVNNLTSPFQLSRPTIQDYLFLLQRMFLLEELPAWHRNHKKRLVKTPKLHINDTGIACALMNIRESTLARDRSVLGPILETFVLQELKRQASAHEDAHAFFHYREKDGAEVDIVIERGSSLVGVEVKAAATASKSDFRGLRRLKAAAGGQFVAGVLLYNGRTGGSFGDGLYALPFRSLWETGGEL